MYAWVHTHRLYYLTDMKEPSATRMHKAGQDRSILRGGPVSARDSQRLPPILLSSPVPLSLLNLKASRPQGLMGGKGLAPLNAHVPT